MHTSDSFDEPVVLPPALIKEIDTWLRKYPPNQRQSAIIPALLTAQRYYQGWLPRPVIDAVAEYIQIPKVAAYEVATFYSMLELEPVGQYKISVCTNVSCLLNGCDRLVQHLQKRLNLQFGETSQDQRFTLKEVECLGACTKAPVIMVNDRYHDKMSVKKMDAILDNPDQASK